VRLQQKLALSAHSDDKVDEMLQNAPMTALTRRGIACVVERQEMAKNALLQ